MARAGRSSGGSRSSGSRSSSRSGGSFRSSGSSSRAGRSYSSSSRSSYSSGSHYHGHSHHHHYYGGTRYVGPRTGMDYVISFLVIVFIIMVFARAFFTSAEYESISPGKSTIERTRVESGLAYDTDVVIEDELRWIEDKAEVGRELRYFWDKTGVQPYILFLKYDDNYVSDESREAYTQVLYEEHIDREDAFLFVYFADKNEDVDGQLFCYALGKQAASVMDGEAASLWFDRLEYYWYGDYDTTDVLINAYTKTADVIMSVSTNGWDVLKVVTIGLFVVGGLVVVAVIIKMKNKRKKEEAEETQAILNASMSNLMNSKTEETDDVLNKYK